MVSFSTKLLSKVKNFRRKFYRVPYCVPAWGWAEHWAILRCLLIGHLIEGNDKEKLYDKVKKKTGVRYVFGFNSGREAIQAALQAKGIGVGDQVIMPSYCCESVARAVTATGARPLFCDIGDDYNPDIHHILKILNPSVKSVIFTHLFGNPGAIDRLEIELEDKGIRSRILLIDDAAQSFGAKLSGRLVGMFGDAGIVSFGPGKTMTASGGGLLLTNSEELAKRLAGIKLERMSCPEKLRRLTYYVVFRRWRRFTLPLYPMIKRILENIESQKNRLVALCNVDGAIALEQLRKHEDLLRIRIERKKRLDEYISEEWKDQVVLLPSNQNPERSLNVATKYIFRFRESDGHEDVQERYLDFFATAGIEIQGLYRPIHLGQRDVVEVGPLEKTESVSKTVVQIPIEPSLSQRQFDSVLRVFKEIKARLG